MRVLRLHGCMIVKVEDLYEYARATVLASGQFPPLELTAAQRRTFGGRIVSRVQEFVGRAGRGMLANQEAFAGDPVQPEALLERQRRAQAWRCLADGFLLLHRWAHDWYLLEQGTAAAEAKSVVDRLRADEESRGRRSAQGDGKLTMRRMALAAAIELLEPRRRKARADGARAARSKGARPGSGKRRGSQVPR